MSDDVIDFDGDKVELSVRGARATVFACDEVDAIREKIKAADEANSLPMWTNPDTFLEEPGTHGRGQEFVNLLKSHFAGHGLNVRDNVAFAIWNALVKKAEEYRDFFENGRSSPAPSASPQPESSADQKVAALLSTMQDASGQQSV